MSLTLDRLLAYLDRRPQHTQHPEPCSQTCLCVRHVTDWQRGDPLAGIPAAHPWTPGRQR